MTILLPRRNAPVQSLLVGEELTVCTYCFATRTELIAIHPDGSRREDCPGCGQRYDVEDYLEEEQS